MLRGAFKPGERLREVPLAARLNVSRTPLRLVLDRLAQEGLLKARPTGGFVASEFSVEDIRDAIEIRGVLEGAAAHRAAERFKTAEEVAGLQACVVALDMPGPRNPRGQHRVLRPLHRSQRAVPRDRARAGQERHDQPFDGARADAPVRVAERLLPDRDRNRQEGKETILLSQAHHRAIASAIIDGDASRAEMLAREHSRLARTNLENALKLQQSDPDSRAHRSIKFPEAI